MRSFIFFMLVAGLSWPLLAEKAPDFRLRDTDGRSHELHRQVLAKGVALLVTAGEDSVPAGSLKAWAQAEAELGEKGIVFWVLDASPEEKAKTWTQAMRRQEIQTPILMDSLRLIARSLHVPNAGEVLLVETREWNVVYRGAVSELGRAVTQLLQGEAISPEKTKFAAGVPIPIEPMKEVSYSRDIAPVLKENCVKCHSEGNIGPFAFSSYERVRGWASTIREVLLTQRMPPWHADPDFGVFENDCSLPPEKVRQLVDWIDLGTPRGAGEDLLAKAEVEAADWPMGKPDYIVSMPRTLYIPETGVFPYQYYTVDAPVTEDVWLKAAVVKPGNLKVLHHCLVFIQYPPELKHLQPNARGGIDGYFAGFVPGYQAVPFPEGTGKFLPKGSRFRFQMHYNATGKKEQDRTELGLYLMKEKPPMELQSRAAANTNFKIPPGVKDFEVNGDFRFAKDAYVFELSPHMHFRGSRFKYEAVYPDGRRETILSVPHYDFNWQTHYRFAKPLRVPAGTRIIATGAFDNSVQNPFNPDPTQWVYFGEQTYEEMFIGYIEFANIPEGFSLNQSGFFGSAK